MLSSPCLCSLLSHDTPGKERLSVRSSTPRTQSSALLPIDSFFCGSLSCPLCPLQPQRRSQHKHTRPKPTLDPWPYLLLGPPALMCDCVVYPKGYTVKRPIYAAFRKSDYLLLLQHKEQFPSSHWRSRRLEVQTWDQSSVQSSFSLLRHLGPHQPSAGRSTSLWHRQNKQYLLWSSSRKL